MSSLVANMHFVDIAKKQFRGYLWKIGGEIIPSTYFEQTQLTYRGKASHCTTAIFPAGMTQRGRLYCILHFEDRCAVVRAVCDIEEILC